MTRPEPSSARGILPGWLRKRLSQGSAEPARRILGELGLNTVCREARCPNLEECFSRRTATFLILGPRCTRSCRFCSVERGVPAGPDPNEPARLAEAARRLALRHVVITSVTRDDLEDGGARHFDLTIRAVRQLLPSAAIEVLTPDFNGSRESIETVCRARPDVFNHNIETVRRLTGEVRSGADYERSLGLLRRVGRNHPEVRTKSGLMVGLGETESEIHEALEDLREAGVRMVTIGQYLKPAPGCLEVSRYVPPDLFQKYKGLAAALGFEEAAAGPFVRSSYRAEELFQNARTFDINDPSGP